MAAAHTETFETARPGRRPELDAIRTLVVVGLVFFHSALVFDTRDDYYVKNAETTDATTIAAGLGVVWAMPMLFLIAGLGSWHSLRRRGPAGFAVERLLRLGVPLVFATLTLLPVPQWLRLRADPGYHESYPAFLPRFFDVRLEPAEFPFVVETPAATDAPPSRGRRMYGYLAAAALPLYVLHQPIVVGVAYGVVGWDAPIAVKYLAIVTASLVLTVVAYDLLVRRTRVTRFLFGMRG